MSGPRIRERRQSLCRVVLDCFRLAALGVAMTISAVIAVGVSEARPFFERLRSGATKQSRGRGRQSLPKSSCFGTLGSALGALA